VVVEAATGELELGEQEQREREGLAEGQDTGRELPGQLQRPELRPDQLQRPELRPGQLERPQIDPGALRRPMPAPDDGEGEDDDSGDGEQ